MKSILKWLSRIFFSRWLPWSLLISVVLVFVVSFTSGELAIPRLFVTPAQRSAALRLYSQHNLDFAEFTKLFDHREEWRTLRTRVLDVRDSRQRIDALLTHLRSEFQRLETSEAGRKIAADDSLLHQYVRIRERTDLSEHALEPLDQILKDGLLVCDLRMADDSLGIGTEHMNQFRTELQQIVDLEAKLQAYKILLKKLEASAYYRPTERSLSDCVQEVQLKGFGPYVDSVQKNLLTPAEEQQLKNLDRERERVGQNLMYSCAKSFEANEIIRLAFKRFDDANYETEEKAKSQSNSQ
jgi:hypothetical protein